VEGEAGACVLRPEDAGNLLYSRLNNCTERPPTSTAGAGKAAPVVPGRCSSSTLSPENKALAEERGTAPPSTHKNISSS